MTAKTAKTARRQRPGEFELIARFFAPLATDPGAFGLTDDAALCRPRQGEELVITTDMITAGVHFFADDPPASVARKALRVNLSDLAAKGAAPFGYLVSLALPADWTEDWVRGFVRGLKADQRRYGVSLLGGDTVGTSGGLTVAITAVGRVAAGGMVLRSGARPGEAVYVSGTLGDAALGLAIRRGTIEPANGAKRLLDRYLHPEPRVRLAPLLGRFASSAVDVSDGLVADLGHVCGASGVGAHISWEAIPLSAAARRLVSGDSALIPTIVSGGEDYEIVATVPRSKADRFQTAAKEAGVPVTRIGQIVAGGGPPLVRDLAGRPLKLTAGGHTHF